MNDDGSREIEKVKRVNEEGSIKHSIPRNIQIVLNQDEKLLNSWLKMMLIR